MKEYLKRLPKEIQDLIYLASDTASRKNMPAYLVGGFVRDLILGVKNFDLDILVEGDGITFAEDFAGRLKAKLIRHSRFGTATLSLRHNFKVDIATARCETYPHPASLPIVTQGRLKDDLARRDFTINAMAISITGKNFGRLIDFFGGRNDLRHKQIRGLHNLSFIDDPTRILRAVRFEKRYNFRIEPKTLGYLKAGVKLKMLEKVQPQRLRDELILILKEEQPLKQIKRLQELTGFNFLYPRLTAASSTYRLLHSIEKEIRWFMRTYPQRRILDTWLIYFMGLTDSLNKNKVRLICKKFALARGEEKRMLSYKKLNSGFILRLRQARIKPATIFRMLEPLSYEVIVLIKAKYQDPNIQRQIKDFFEIYNGMRILITGADLDRLGVRPGPYYQKIFTRVLKAKLDGRVKTKEEELALIKKMIDRS